MGKDNCAIDAKDVQQSLANLLTIVVLGYDPYKDAIDFSTKYISKFVNFPCKKICVVSEINIIKSGWLLCKTNGDLSFAGRLTLALSEVKTPYVMLLLDDYILTKPINEKRLLQDILFLEKNNKMYCQICTFFNIPHGKKIDKRMILSKRKKYRLNLEPSIFSLHFLREISKLDLSNPWEAEIQMNESFNNIESFYSLNKSAHFINYIDKGLASRKSVRYLKKNGDWKNQRQQMSIYKTIKIKIIRLVYMLLPEKIKGIFKKEKIYK